MVEDGGPRLTVLGLPLLKLIQRLGCVGEVVGVGDQCKQPAACGPEILERRRHLRLVLGLLLLGFLPRAGGRRSPGLFAGQRLERSAYTGTERACSTITGSPRVTSVIDRLGASADDGQATPSKPAETPDLTA